MAILAYIQSRTAQATAATSVTTPSMTTTSANFLAGAVAQGAQTIAGTPIVDNKTNTWQTAWIQNAVNGNSALYYVENVSGGTGHTATFTGGGQSEPLALAVLEFSGVLTSGSLNKTSHSTGGTAPHNSGSITTDTVTEQLLIGSASDSVQQALPPASWYGFFTDVASLSDSTAEGVIQSYAIVNAIGTYHYEYTYENNSGDSERCGIATFKGTNIAYVQSKSAQSSGATTITTPSMTSTSGNFLATVVTSFIRTFSGSPVTDSKSNAWSAAWAGNHCGCYYAENITGGAGHTVTNTPTGGTDTCAIAVSEFSGILTSSSLDQTANANTTGEPRLSGAVTTTQAQELLIGGGSVTHITNIPYSTINGLYTDAVALRHVINGNQGIIVSYRFVSAFDTYDYKWSNGRSDTDATGIATFMGSRPPMPSVTPANWQLHRFDLKPRSEDTA